MENPNDISCLKIANECSQRMQELIEKNEVELMKFVLYGGEEYNLAKCFITSALSQHHALKAITEGENENHRTD